ncbi:MAG TPA: hypothetical protein VFZ65_18290 [Planctomycetota bacterium]|nr:hypothetical protein [Planctomycetota bacterium]
MRTTLALILALLLLTLLSVDFVRRVGAAASIDNRFAAPAIAASALRGAQGDHTEDYTLLSFDGGFSTLELRVAPGPGTAIAEVVVDQLELDGKQPRDGLPRKGTPDPAGVVVMTFVFDGVDWRPETHPPRFSAFLKQSCRVLYAGSTPADSKQHSWGTLFWVKDGAAFADLVRARGMPR